MGKRKHKTLYTQLQTKTDISKKKNDNSAETKFHDYKSQIESENIQSILKLNAAAKTTQRMKGKLHIINYKLSQENNYLVQNLNAAA